MCLGGCEGDAQFRPFMHSLAPPIQLDNVLDALVAEPAAQLERHIPADIPNNNGFMIAKECWLQLHVRQTDRGVCDKDFGHGNMGIVSQVEPVL